MNTLLPPSLTISIRDTVDKLRCPGYNTSLDSVGTAKCELEPTVLEILREKQGNLSDVLNIEVIFSKQKHVDHGSIPGF